MTTLRQDLNDLLDRYGLDHRQVVHGMFDLYALNVAVIDRDEDGTPHILGGGVVTNQRTIPLDTRPVREIREDEHQ